MTDSKAKLKKDSTLSLLHLGLTYSWTIEDTAHFTMVTCGPQHFFAVEQMPLLNLGPMPTGWFDIHYLTSQCKPW
jgi:hypothetical protein